MQHLDPQRIARASVLNGVAIPSQTVAQLEARGINVGELEQRLRQSVEFKR
jgi:hypothetical protein